MPKSSPSRLIIIILPLIALVCLGTLAGLNSLIGLPNRVEPIFGPPAPYLSSVQTIRFAALLLWQEQDLTTPAEEDGVPQAFIVQTGESVPSITGRLWREGLITNPGAFRTYLQYSGLDRTLQAGEYTLSPAMTSLEIGQALQDATPTEVSFRVLAGWRIEEIAASLPTSGLQITPADFVAAARTPPANIPIRNHLPLQATLEGFLLPDTYELNRTLTASELVIALVSNFNQKVPSELRAAISRMNLDLYQGVTLASIIQREAIVDEEAPLIASVFLNRLEIGMKLDADPTVQYAVGYNPTQETWWTNPLSADDLSVDSPYNTYRYPGLPPGPIANPGLIALRAVAFPAQTPYFYFRAACDGSGRHAFSETLAEHQQKACP